LGDYYRDQARRARRLAAGISGHGEAARQIYDMAKDYDELADELDVPG